MKKLAAVVLSAVLGAAAQAGVVHYDFEDAQTIGDDKYLNADPSAQVMFDAWVGNDGNTRYLWGGGLEISTTYGSFTRLSPSQRVVARFDYRTEPDYDPDWFLTIQSLGPNREVRSEDWLPATNGEWVTVTFLSPAPFNHLLMGTAIAGEFVWIDNLTMSTVPEPSPVVLIGAGLAALIWARRRKDTREQA